MSLITFAPVIYNQFKRRDGSLVVKIRITYKRQSKFLPTNIIVRAEQLTKSLKLRDPSTRAKVNELVVRMERSVSELDLFALQGMTIDDVANYVIRSQNGRFELDFVDFGLTFVKEKGGKPGKDYRCALNALISFIGKDHFDISLITSSLMRNFERWLVQKYGSHARSVSSYTSKIAFIHKQARLRYNNEESGEVFIKNPFEFYKPPKQTPGRHIGKDIGLLNQMLAMRKELNGRERLGVDVYLISFGLMGMNCPDLYECQENKGGILHYYRHKTTERRYDKAEMYVRVDERVMAIATDYLDHSGTRVFDFHKRYKSYEYLGTAVNIGLKEFGERIAYPEKITLYSARHTWASIARNDAQVSKDLVNDGLCHVDDSMRVTDGYIKKDWRPLWDANESVLNLLKW